MMFSQTNLNRRQNVLDKDNLQSIYQTILHEKYCH